MATKAPTAVKITKAALLQLQSSANKAYTIAVYAEEIAAAAYQSLLTRLRKTEIVNWYHTEEDGVQWVYYNTSSTGKGFKPPTNDSFNKNHLVYNVGHGLSGFIDADWFKMSTNVVRYSASFTPVVTDPTPATGAFFYSCDTTLPPRPAYDIGLWTTKMSARSANKYSFGDFAIKPPTSADGSSFGAPDDVTFASTLWDYWQKCKKDTATKLALFKAALDQVQKLAKLNGEPDPTAGIYIPGVVVPGGKGGGGGGGGGTKKIVGQPKTQLPPPPSPTADLIYNLPAVKEMYFQHTPGFQSNVLFVDGGNQPVVVTQASDLWSDTSKAYKGMIQTNSIYKPLGTSQPTAKPVIVNDINKGPYAFQFIYNPNLVSMAYDGAPKVDPVYEATGQDAANLVGSGASSSTVSFEVLINRMNDMKYVDAILAGTLAANDVYPAINRDDVTNDISMIKEMGTMYDIEHLLRTLLGYGLPSALRHRATADIGYLGAFPVELHLGKSLRYFGTIDSLSLSHTIFTKEMVPVFTNLSITLNRLPDYPPLKAKK